MNSPDRQVFFYLLQPNQVRSGDVLYEINDRPVPGNPIRIHETCCLATDYSVNASGEWELFGETGEPWRVAADARLKVRRQRRRTSDLHAPCRGQMTLFDPTQGVTK
ncbi:hypothetical protein AB0C34_26165 [Nocardia sp. NPDC049220]|uniref:hypothetical protein n=1 Tax=Nocardia sp. NPDC049220 TaxID=3155273 RepID=UPI00340B4829